MIGPTSLRRTSTGGRAATPMAMTAAPIQATDGQSYTLTDADVGATLRVQEIATNVAGPSQPASSAASSLVLPAVPQHTEPPTITGTATQGQTLTEHHAAWTNSPTSYSYQWVRCDNSGTTCQPVSGAIGQSYLLRSDDVGHAIEVQETAQNSGGSGMAASSAPTGVVAAALPESTGPPSISGPSIEGQTLTEQHGTWTNDPTGYSYAWLRCDRSAANCTPIPGAASQTYTIQEADLGSTLKVQEVASNVAGPGVAATSDATDVVVPPPPSASSRPTVSGTAAQGRTLIAHTGDWTNSPTSFSYQWQRCDGLASNCVTIQGANWSDYLIGADDVDHTLIVQVMASNAGGSSAPSNSDATAIVATLPLHADPGEALKGTAGVPLDFDGYGQPAGRAHSELQLGLWRRGQRQQCERLPHLRDAGQLHGDPDGDQGLRGHKRSPRRYGGRGAAESPEDHRPGRRRSADQRRRRRIYRHGRQPNQREDRQ